jgi:hypothetical protein
MESCMKSKNVANGIPRREFLRISSVAAIGVAVAAISERKAFAAASDSGIVPLMGVGYAPSLPLTGYSIPLASADSILSPDPRFISSGAHISVVGSRRAAGHANTPGGIGVDALFATNHRQPGDPSHFTFFSISGRSDADSVSGPISFTMPVLATTGVGLLVRRQRPALKEVAAASVPPSIESEVSPITLSLGNVAGPKLTRGVYAFAFREEESDSMSNWGRLSIVPTEGGYMIPGATFSYLLLHVDYAEQVETAPGRGRASRH